MNMISSAKGINILHQYVNGNTHVTIYDDGTKIREYEGTPLFEFPESIDIKITDFCDMGCKYCFESSTVLGRHGNIEKLLSVLEPLPAGIELALGGGNPLSHPKIYELLTTLKERGFISNITVNQGHLKSYFSFILDLIEKDLVKGIGISIINDNFKYVTLLKEKSNNIVYHLIAGVNEVSILDKLLEIGEPKVLVLGYKLFGFGIEFFSDDVNKKMNDWYKNIHKYIGEMTMSFDNLGINQLEVKRLFTNRGWDKFYMGDDFTHSMYIDVVKNEYAPTSRSNFRIGFDKIDLIKFFKRHYEN